MKKATIIDDNGNEHGTICFRKWCWKSTCQLHVGVWSLIMLEAGYSGLPSDKGLKLYLSHVPDVAIEMVI